jgi:serine/threonine-protein kinase
MIVSLDLFLNTLRRSRLLTAEDVDAEVAHFRSSHAGRKDAKSFAEFLCKRRRLTIWQAQNLLAGKHRGYFVGSYTLKGLVGKGGMSFVYLAEHRLLKRKCAIKVLPAAKAANPALLARFHREARAAATLDHPNVVRMLDGGEIQDGETSVHYLVMEYIEGPTLFDVVRNSGPLSVAKAIDAIRQAARGLQHAHEVGLVHRDIKPENLIVDGNGVVRLMDLGLARFVESNDERLTIQQEGRVLGTANYCSPEQAIDSHRVDARADIYSLGCTLYFLLAGRPPFHEGSLAQRLLAHQNRQPDAIDKLRSDVPPELSALLMRMMAKSPAQRIATAREVADALDQMLDSTGQLRVHKTEKRPAASPVRAAAASRVVGDPLSELREAIGKVNSVERAVAMLKLELPTAKVDGPFRKSKHADQRKQRAARRQSNGRRMLSGVTLSLAILIATLSTWSSPQASPGKLRTIAVLEPGPVRRDVTPRAVPPRPAGSPARPRAVVAHQIDGLRAGL